MRNPSQVFDARLRRIDRIRARLVHGYECRVGEDGLIVFRPKRRRRAFSVRGLFLIVVGFFCFKGLILAHLGPSVYQDRVAALEGGTYAEQAGALVMQVDPVSSAIAGKLRPFVRKSVRIVR